MKATIETGILTIETIEVVDGKTLKDFWKFPMYLVNNEFIASSEKTHNIYDWPFDLTKGETANVSFKEHEGYVWIARSNQPLQPE